MIMLGFERRWAQALLEAFAPPESRGLSPEPQEVDYVAGFRRMLDSFTPRASLGLRAALWISALAPVWMQGRPRSVARLPMAGRTELLRKLLEHRSFLVRELAFLLKTSASFALMGTPSVRARSGYDRGVTPVWEDASGSRTRLPVTGAPTATQEEVA